MKRTILYIYALFVCLGSGFAQTAPFPCDQLSVDSIQTCRVNPHLIAITITNHDESVTWGPTRMSILSTTGDSVGNEVMCGCVILFKGATGTFNITPKDTSFRVPAHYCAQVILTGSGSTCTKSFNQCMATGLPTANTTNKALNLFPNPAKDVFTLELGHQPLAEALLSLLNLHGKQVFSETLTSQSTQLDVSSLPKGIYLIRVLEQGVLSETKKIVLY
jgi:hypothetical protein